ncbi:MAG: hypothetical protein GXZ15_00600 [Campylobacter sp.]|nr:hypothetical protein [Campylobacter sp.]
MLKEGKVIGVIELKDYKTKNLTDVELQAFNYHNSHQNSRYIITSNFSQLRFYIDKKTAYEQFNLLELSYENFKKLHLLLSFESVSSDIPLKLFETSKSHETRITKELYKDFSKFRLALFDDICKSNQNINKRTLLKLTQKLCERIIFILFAEDRGLLDANTIVTLNKDFIEQKYTNFTLYEIYKLYFTAIDKGNEKQGIPAYNGGLFAADNELDSLVINDDILLTHTDKLSKYDFLSDISVNILGHIFEQSLSDLE